MQEEKHKVALQHAQSTDELTLAFVAKEGSKITQTTKLDLQLQLSTKTVILLTSYE